MRDLSAAFIAAVETGSTRPRIFFEGVFTGGTLRIWTGLDDISWNGHTWIGAGSVMGVSSIQETSEIKAVQFAISLNGISSSIIALALEQCRQGYTGKCYLGLLAADGSIIADPFTSFAGYCNGTPDILDAGETCTIGVRYESRLADPRPRVRHYTSQDQQRDFPGDLGFDQVPLLQDMKIPWGRPDGASPPMTVIGEGPGVTVYKIG